MVYEVVLPKLGVEMERGTLLEWHKKEGDSISSGEDIFLVETEKTTMEVSAVVTGKILRIIHPDGTPLAAGQVVALVAVPGEEVTGDQLEEALRKIEFREGRGAEAARAQSPAVNATVDQQKRQSQRPLTETGGGGATGRGEAGEDHGESKSQVRASPAARRLMREKAVDPASVVGTGPGGTISAQDVLRRIQEDSDFRVSSTTQLSGRRLATAEKLGKSEAVQVILMTEVDATSLDGSRSRISSSGGETTALAKPSITAILVSMVSRALKLHARMNAVLEGGQLRTIENINIGVAVDTPEGLIVPVIKNVDRLSLSDIAERLKEVEARALDSSLSYEDVSNGTFTVTNLGMLGIEEFTPVINPPQVAILGVGRMKEKPTVVQGAIAIRKMMTFSLTFDHRAVDGADGARFLGSLKQIVEESNA